MDFILHPSTEQLATMVQANMVCVVVWRHLKRVHLKKSALSYLSKLFWQQEVAGKLAVSPHRKKGFAALGI
jgi:hypothetical protein